MNIADWAKLLSTQFLALVVGFTIAEEVYNGEWKMSPKPYYEYVYHNDSYVAKFWPLHADAAAFRKDFDTAVTRTFKYESQFDQDRIILTFFRDKPDGYFIDLATNDWEEGSNTLVVEHFNNWRGVCIEPNPQYREGILGNRKCTLFTAPITDRKGEEVQFRFAARGWGALGGVVKPEYDNHDSFPDDVTLHTTTITDILDFVKAPPIIDYMSLDIEGAELDALRGFNFSKYKFLALTIERPKEHVHEYLVRHGYMWVFVFPGGAGECIYLHHTMPEFEKWMNEYRDCCDPCWSKTCHHYMTLPAWDKNVGYVPVVRHSDHHHHNTNHSHIV